MRNKVEACVTPTTDSQIKFEELRKKIIFLNPERHSYKRVKVDGCVLKDGLKCDDLLLSDDEHEERYVELKGTDVMHAIEQLESTIMRLGEFEECRHCYVVSTNVAPAFNTKIQQKKKYFKERYRASLEVRERQMVVPLY